MLREVISHHQNKAMKNKEDTITVELVWGHRGKEGKIIGESYHQLTGPTARSSMSAYAEDLNMRKVPPSKAVRCVADGCRLPKNDPNQLGLVLMIQPNFKKP